MSKTDRRFLCWNSVQLVLKRASVPCHGKTATLLLETFIEDSGRLTASKVVSRGLCNEGEFSAWRKQLIEKGWLIWSETQSDKGQYFPGKKLMPYVNKEKISSRELVTKDEVLPKSEAATKEEFQALKARMSRIEDVVQELKKAVEPPDTEEKRLARERATARLDQLAKAN
jgi:hypothetical protein